MEPRTQTRQLASCAYGRRCACGLRVVQADTFKGSTGLHRSSSCTACLQDPHLQNRPELLDVAPPAERELGFPGSVAPGQRPRDHSYPE